MRGWIDEWRSVSLIFSVLACALLQQARLGGFGRLACFEQVGIGRRCVGRDMLTNMLGLGLSCEGGEMI